MSVINNLINNVYTLTTLIVCHVYMDIFHVCIKNIIFSIYKSITFLLFPSGLTNTNPNHNEWCENEKHNIFYDHKWNFKHRLFKVLSKELI